MATIPSVSLFVPLEFPPAAKLNAIRDAVEFFKNPPHANVYATATGSPGSGSTFTPDFDTERVDTDGMHSTVTNPSRLTIVTPGTYDIVARSAWAANNTGNRELRLMLNAATQLDRDIRPALDSSPQRLILNDFPLAAGDYLWLVMIQTSGAGLASAAGGAISLSARWVGV